MNILYVAGVSISENPKDIPLKTLNIIKECTFAIGEERKYASRLLNASGSDAVLMLLNEHSTDDDRSEVLKELLKHKKSVLFSDAGTPCISDPDYRFIHLARKSGVKIISLPGASSITTAISVSGIDAASFFFAGFPPRDSRKRKDFFQDIEKSKTAVVFMERPYALEATLKDISFINRKISISLNLGMDSEENYYDYPAKLIEKLSGKKAPFVIVVPKQEKKEQKRNFKKR